MALVQLKGWHGTSTYRAMQIVRGGNRFVFGLGRVGKAAYLWLDGKHSKYLGITWFRQIRDEGRLDPLDTTKHCSVLEVDIEADALEILNTDDDELLEAVQLLGESQGVNVNRTKELSDLWDLFLRSLQKKQGVTYKVLRARVSAPKNSDKYPFPVLRLPKCLAIRDNTVIKAVQSHSVSESEVSSA